MAGTQAKKKKKQIKAPSRPAKNKRGKREIGKGFEYLGRPFTKKLINNKSTGNRAFFVLKKGENYENRN